jgi:hypothetical protein
VSTLAAPAAPIVIPIAAGVVFAKWLYDVYQNSSVTITWLRSRGFNSSMLQTPDSGAHHGIYNRLDSCHADYILSCAG